MNPDDPTTLDPADAPDPAAEAATEHAASAERGGRLRRLRMLHVALILVAVIAGSGLFIGGWSLGARSAASAGTPVDLESAFAPFWEAWRAVNSQYVGTKPVDQKLLVEGAIRGMLGSLNDPYSSYMTAEEFKATLESLSGQFGGIGASMGTKSETGADATCSTLTATCRMTVIQPLENTPASRAGLQTGDQVIAIDGVSVDGLTFDAAIAKVRGEKGTTVRLTIRRGTAEPFEISLVREVIVQKEVQSKELAGGTVEYVKILQFSDSAATDFQAVVSAAVKAGRTRFVLDLRDNPGGYVTAAQKVASEFIGSGPIYWQEDATGNRGEIVAQTGGSATGSGIQVLVLVNKGSASASEIVAGALQDTGRGTLVGEQTYGKGVIQEWHQLSGDNGGFRLTVAKWLTPKLRWIQGTGLTPDVAVTVPTDTPEGSDPVLDKALTLFASSSATSRAGAGAAAAVGADFALDGALQAAA